MKIKIQTRMTYGRPLHYPMCEVSRLVAQLLARPDARKRGECFHVTLSDKHIEVLKVLGHEIEYIPWIVPSKDKGVPNG